MYESVFTDDQMKTIAAEVGVEFISVIKIKNENNIEGAPLIRVDNHEYIVIAHDALVNPIPIRNNNKLYSKTLAERLDYIEVIRAMENHISCVTIFADVLSKIFYDQRFESLYSDINSKSQANVIEYYNGDQPVLLDLLLAARQHISLAPQPSPYQYTLKEGLLYDKARLAELVKSQNEAYEHHLKDRELDVQAKRQRLDEKEFAMRQRAYYEQQHPHVSLETRMEMTAQRLSRAIFSNGPHVTIKGYSPKDREEMGIGFKVNRNNKKKRNLFP